MTGSGCHLCHDARAVLDQLATQYRFVVEGTDISSPRGSELTARSPEPFVPILFINGVYHQHGRISAKKLARTLKALAAGNHETEDS